MKDWECPICGSSSYHFFPLARHDDLRDLFEMTMWGKVLSYDEYVKIPEDVRIETQRRFFDEHMDKIKLHTLKELL